MSTAHTGSEHTGSEHTGSEHTAPEGHAAPDGRPLLRDMVREQLRSAILAGQLPTGSRLDDDALAHAYGCSRTPVREALNDLVHMGLVELEANRATRVAVPRAEDVVPAVQALGLLFGGLVRVTVPGLDERARLRLIGHLTALLERMGQPDRRSVADVSLPVYRGFIDASRNALLAGRLAASLDWLTFRLRRDDLRALLPWEQMRNGVVALRLALDCGDAVLAERATWSIHLLPDPRPPADRPTPTRSGAGR